MTQTEWDQHLTEWKARALAPVTQQKSLSALSQAFLTGSDAEGSGSTLVSAYQQSVWVYSCVNVIGRQLAGARFALATMGAKGETEIERGPLFDLFQQPHPMLDRFQFWELITAWLLLRGEAFVIVLDRANNVLNITDLASGRGKPARMLVLAADRFTHKVSMNRLIGWQYSASNQEAWPTENFLPEEVLHLRMPNPFDFWRGLGPLSVARLAADSDYASAQMERGLVKNNGAIQNIVRTDQQLTEEQRLQFEAAYKSSLRQAGTAHRPLFLSGGMEVVKPELSAADMQFLEGRKFKRQEICSAFGVPQEILGYTEDANRSVGDAARLNFIENTMMPLGDRIEAPFQKIVRSAGENVVGYFDWDELPVMAAARRSRVDTGLKLWQMSVPFADINEELDLGLPDRPWYAKGYLPFSVSPAGEDNSPPDEVIDAEPVTEEDELEKAFKKLEKAVSGRADLPVSPDMGRRSNAALPTHTCAANPRWESALNGAVRLVKSKVQRFLFEQRSRVLAALPAAIEGKAVSNCCGVAFKGQSDLCAKCGEHAVTRALDDLDALIRTENQRLLGVMNPLLRQVLNFGGQQLYQELNLSDIFAIPPARAVEFLNTRENAITGINATTFEKLKTSLQEGLTNGDTFPQLVDRVKETYKGVSDLQAEVIANTETNIAANAGRFEGMKSAGVQLKGWQTTGDQRTRASHQQAQRDYENGIPLDKPFRVGGVELMFPGDPSGPAEEVINCRCFTFAILTDKAAPANAPLLNWGEFCRQRGLDPVAPSKSFCNGSTRDCKGIPQET